MALERAIYVVILCFFALGSATICSYDGKCNQWSGESCCSDSVCRKNCFYCSLDSDCGTGEECCDGGDCSTFCFSGDSSSLTGAHTAGAIVGTMVFFAIVISCVACFCCTCCPYYRNRSPGTATDQQTLVSTTQLSAMSSEPVQHYPPSGPSPPNYSLPPPVAFNQPPPPNYNQPPPLTYNQPPPVTYSQPPPPNYNQSPPSGSDQASLPYNPDCLQQQAQYPPPVQGQPPTAPPLSSGEPVKY